MKKRSERRKHCSRADTARPSSARHRQDRLQYTAPLSLARRRNVTRTRTALWSCNSRAGMEAGAATASRAPAVSHDHVTSRNVLLRSDWTSHESRSREPVVSRVGLPFWPQSHRSLGRPGLGGAKWSERSDWSVLFLYPVTLSVVDSHTFSFVGELTWKYAAW